MEQIERIAHMERILDEGAERLQKLYDALEQYREFAPQLDELEAYYSGPQWMHDYEDDCAGRLPKDLRRGVLSEDAVFDLLSMRSMIESMLAPKE